MCNGVNVSMMLSKFTFHFNVFFCQGGFYSPAAAPAVGLLNRRFAGGGHVHAGFFLASKNTKEHESLHKKLINAYNILLFTFKTLASNDQPA